MAHVRVCALASGLMMLPAAAAQGAEMFIYPAPAQQAGFVYAELKGAAIWDQGNSALWDILVVAEPLDPPTLCVIQRSPPEPAVPCEFVAPP